MKSGSRYLFVGRIAARQQWVYRAELLARAVSMVLFMGVFIALWSTAYSVSGREELAGYSLAQIIWYLGMAETITLSTSRIFIEIGEAVRSGDLAYTLIRPLRYPFFQVANSLGNSAPRFALNLLTAVVVVLVGTGQVVGSWQGLLTFLGMALLALVLDALFAVLIGLSAFWMEETMPLYLIYQKLLFSVGGLFLPLEVFPGWLQQVARWLPFQLITYAPARAFVAFDGGEAGGAVLGQLLYIALLSGVVMLVWAFARRRMVVHGG
ncbi:MAG: ABC transporter permease [Anaerolineales bacterium]